MPRLRLVFEMARTEGRHSGITVAAVPSNRTAAIPSYKDILHLGLDTQSGSR